MIIIQFLNNIKAPRSGSCSTCIPRHALCISDSSSLSRSFPTTFFYFDFDESSFKCFSRYPLILTILLSCSSLKRLRPDAHTYGGASSPNTCSYACFVNL